MADYERLTEQILELMYDYDPYEFDDTECDNEYVTECIENGDIIDILYEISEDDDLRPRALRLLKQLGEY